jgi:Outer membrane protein beta-barrel family
MAKVQNILGVSVLAMSCVLLNMTPVRAQADSAITHPSEAVTVYAPAFFDSYNPVTALDLVRQVPGFSISNGERARGFGGTAGNVLINGERPSTKSNALQEILGRIALSRVVRVELIRGSVPRIDMRGQTRVVNVVLSGEDVGGQGTFNVRGTLWRDRMAFNGEATYGFRVKGADITFSLQRDGQGRRPEGTEDTFNTSGTLIEHREETDQRWFRQWQPSFTAEKKFSNGDALRLNGKYWNWMWDRNETSRVEGLFGGALIPNGFSFNLSDNKGNGFELGGDYERTFSGERSAKLIFVKTRTADQFLNTSEDFVATGFEGAFRVKGNSISNETIMRLIYDWTLGPKHTVQFGAEGALNALNSGLDVFQDTGAGLVQIPLPVSNTRVSEKRGEMFGSWVFSLSKKWTLESGLRYEFSEISQSGDASRKRTFKFPKPSFSATWDVSEHDQFRVSIVRKVSQLNFGDFVSNINLSDSRTNLGNPELEPDRTWAFETSWERRFGKKGSVNVKYHQDWISAAQGRVPINNAFDGPGNLGNARRWFVDFSARFPLDGVGVKGATLDASWFAQGTRVTDPVTGQTRPLDGNISRNWSLNFRQDINTLKLAWGWSYDDGFAFQQFRLFERQSTNFESGRLNVFVETTYIKGITITTGFNDILDQKSTRTRTFFTGSRANGIVSGSQVRIRSNGPLYYIRVKGTF